MKSLTILFLALITNAAFAAQLPARNCEIFISKVHASPSSHGSAAISATVKVGWIGNGEFIQRVGMVAQSASQDLGNAPSCHYSGSQPSDFRVIDPVDSHGYDSLEYGEYAFQFYVISGSVVDQCPGFHMSTVGSFFVETNKNTYWLNPNLDSSQNFYFDANGYQTLAGQFFYTDARTADHESLNYYNPLNCR